MSEGIVGTTPSYDALIEEVFIKPIRTVVVVDDEFPTIDALLDKEIDGSGQQWGTENLKRVRQIIQFCREDQRRWMVEIHDGREILSLEAERDVASHLHQSDLMILDFHLDPSKPDDGSSAIGILRRLAENEHFNLVVVYTKGYGQVGGEIPRVVMEIALGLSIADDRLNMAEQALQKVVQLLESWEDYDAEIGGKIEDAIDDGTYLKIRNLPAGNINWKDICSWTELNALQTIVAGAPSALSPQPDIKLLAKWALFRKQNALASKLAVKDYGAARFESGYVSGINWVRNDRIFVTVVSKQDAPPLELPEKLLKALCDWDPAPHRLLMSKMRAELDERGVWAEGRVLGDRHLQAGWLSEYLTDDLDERQWKVHSTVNRHWEGLGDSIRNNVVEFADRLATHLRGEGREKAIGKWYPSVAQDEMTYSLNHYVSSKSVVEGGYLTTGHVLRLDSDVGDGCFWLCLSPACDLVPGQKSTGWYKRLGAHTPFIAVQLFDANKEDALQQAASGNHLFLKINDVFKSFSFTPASTDAVRATNPKWEQMFAAQQGRFQGEDNKFMVARAADGENGLLAFKSEPAQVVAHLRYEYALNLLHRLGANLSRVGLDFVGMRPAGNG